MAAAVDNSVSCPPHELDKDRSHAAAMVSSSARDPPGRMDTSGYCDSLTSSRKDQEIVALNAELGKWRQLHAMVSKDVRDNEAKLIEKSLECTILQASFSEQQETIERLNSAMHKSKMDQMESMRREKKLSEALNATQARRKSLQAEISSLTVSMKKKDEDIDYLRSIVQQLRRDKRDLREKLSGHSGSGEEEVETVERQGTATDDLISEYSKQINRLQAENEKRTAQARENLSKLFAVQTQTEKIESKSKKNLRRLRRDQERLQLTVRALETCKSKLREKTKEVESLQGGMEDAVSCDTSRSNFSGRCVVYHGREANVALLPCAHVCLCTSCAGEYSSRMETCPMCSQFYDDTLRVYLG